MMDPMSTPARYWAFEGRVPVDFAEGSVSVGAAYHVETGERVTSLQIRSGQPPSIEGELWLTADETQDLAARLLGMMEWLASEEAFAAAPPE